MLRTTSDPTCEAFYRKRPRPLSLKSKPTQFFSSHSTSGILYSSITTPILELEEDNLNLSLLHTSELPSPKKLRPSRECATIPNGSLKSAFKSPAQSPNTTCPTTPDTDFGGKISVGIVEMDSTFPFSSARASSPTRKNVHFNCDETEVDSLTTVMLSIHLTHSPQSYDRSPIDVGPSLLLPPRSSSDLCEESEVESSEEDWSDPELGLDLSRTSSIHQAGIGNLHALNPLALTSALDGF